MIKQGKRNLSIDGLRGLLLIIIAINHLDSRLITPWTREPFGFVSAAEGFVFISGVVAALVYRGLLTDFAALSKKIWSRAFEIYLYAMFAVLLITTFLHAGVLSAIWVDELGEYFYLENYYKFPVESLFLSLFYIQQIAYIDVLFIYVVTLLFLPYALVLLSKGKWLLLLIVSGSLWLASGFVSDSFLGPVVHALNPGMKVDAGYADILAWQFIFCLGLMISYGYPNIKRYLSDSNAVFYIFLALAAALFVLKRFDAFYDFENLWVSSWFSWRDVGVFRLVNTLALAYIVYRLFCAFPNILALKYLVFLGQNSLQVFVFHSVAIYFLLPQMELINENYHPLKDLALVLAFIASLYLPAILRNLIKQKSI